MARKPNKVKDVDVEEPQAEMIPEGIADTPATTVTAQEAIPQTRRQRCRKWRLWPTPPSNPMNRTFIPPIEEGRE